MTTYVNKETEDVNTSLMRKISYFKISLGSIIFLDYMFLCPGVYLLKILVFFVICQR